MIYSKPYWHIHIYTLYLHILYNIPLINVAKIISSSAVISLLIIIMGNKPSIKLFDSLELRTPDWQEITTYDGRKILKHFATREEV